MLATLPMLGCLLLAALLAPLALGGFNFAPCVLAPNFNRLDPVQSFGRMFTLRALGRTGEGHVDRCGRWSRRTLRCPMAWASALPQQQESEQ